MSLEFKTPSSEEIFPSFMTDEGSFAHITSVDDAAIDSAVAGTEGDESATPNFIGLAVGKRQLRQLFMFIGLLLIAIVARAADMQIIRGSAYVAQAERNRTVVDPLPSPRGVIYDRKGVALAQNIPSFSLTITPALLPSDVVARRNILAQVADTLGIAPTDIEDAITRFPDRAREPVVVADKLTHEQAVRIAIETADNDAVTLRIGTRREYPLSATIPSLSHLLGYMGRVSPADLKTLSAGDYTPSDFVGKAGLESQYESEMRGVFGASRSEVDATGRKVGVVSVENGDPGKNIVLSIDADLQKEAESALASELRVSGKKRGSVIILRPSTGEVLAMVSLPAYDDNLFSQGLSAADYAKYTANADHPLFSRAISGLLPPGSVFKPVIGAGALDAGVITKNTTVNSVGGISVGQWFFPDWKAGGHGITNIEKAIAESVNTFFYIVGGGYQGRAGLGVERIGEYARRFGFGSPLGIDLPGESAGFIPSKDWKERVKGQKWFIGDTYHFAIGQGDLLVTPLQIAAETAAVANGGRLMQPHIVNAFSDANGSRTLRMPVVLRDHIVSDDAITEIQKGMRMTVTAGSARSLNLLPIPISGKTGTAQWSSRHSTHAWFTSYAPSDHPDISVTVVIEEGGEGSSVSVPVAREIYSYYFGVRNPIPISPNDPTLQQPSEAVTDQYIQNP